MRTKVRVVGLLALLGVFTAVGCSGLPKLPSACDKLTERSYLCEICKKNGVRLEDVGNGLIIANAIAIGQGLYSKADALAVFKELRAVLNDPVSYAFFKAKVDEKMARYPGLIEVAVVYFNELSALDDVMFTGDKLLLIGWMDQQIRLLGGGA